MSANTVLTAEDMSRTLNRLAYQVLERHGSCEDLAIVGIQRRGVDLAARLLVILEKHLSRAIPFGKLDINLYRDDWTTLNMQPLISRTEIDFPIDDKRIILVDDVLFSGRTIRAALEATLDFGRPLQVELMTLVDRGHRELPIQADYVGTSVDTQKGQHVNVYVNERDGYDLVCLVNESGEKCCPEKRT